MEADFLLSSYRFDLPEAQIAQAPPAVRGASRLMVLGREAGSPLSTTFDQLIDHLPPRSLLVVNNSQVIPARLFGQRATGGRVEFLLLTPLPLVAASSVLEEGTAATLHSLQQELGDTPAGVEWHTAVVEGLLRSSKRVTEDELVRFSPSLFARLRKKGEFGHAEIALFWQGNLQNVVESLGVLPLPPYIRREAPQPGAEKAVREGTLARMDKERYQTVYAKENKAGSVAAPTAGLHFTQELRNALQQAGHEWAEATLYVGYGTFSPVRCDDIREHPMHAEYVELPEATVEAIVRAKLEKRPVITVGTTSTRILEGVWRAQHAADQPHGKNNTLLRPHHGWINLFLYPGEAFHVIDGLITNFHLPESSLLMLVSAFAGRERILAAYTQAVHEGFRFFSYGDAMFIRPGS